VDLSLRPCFGVRGPSACAQSRPISALGDVTIRQTNARSRYDGFTIRSNYRNRRVQLQAFYTLSYSYSDDDNERLASGFDYDNDFNLKPEYGFSRLDARHLLQYNTLVDLPWGFTISSLGRFRSGRPLDALSGTDAILRQNPGPPASGPIVNIGNGDGNSFGDRPFAAPGVPFTRNSFRDRRNFSVDLRLAKKFRIREGMHIDVTADFFNLFNFDNIVYVGGTPSPFNPTQVFGMGVDPATGNVLAPNARFRQLKNPSFCGQNKACYDTANTPGPPFTAQLGIRFNF